MNSRNAVIVPRHIRKQQARLPRTLQHAIDATIDDIVQFGQPDDDAWGRQVGDEEVWLWLSWPLDPLWGDVVVESLVVLRDSDPPNFAIYPEAGSSDPSASLNAANGQGQPAAVLYLIRPDQRGILARIAADVERVGCNIEALAMGIMGEHFWLTILVTGVLQQLNTELPHIERRLGVRLLSTRTHLHPKTGNRFSVIVTGFVDARIVRRLAGILLEHRGNIAGGAGGSELDYRFDMLELVAEPREILTPELWNELEQLADEEGLRLQLDAR